MIDVQATLSALRDASPELHIPAGHPLADAELRSFFLEAMEALAPIPCVDLPGLEPVPDAELEAAVARQAPICTLASGYVAAGLRRAEALMAGLPPSPLADRLRRLCGTAFRQALVAGVTQRVQQTVALEYNIALLDAPGLEFAAFCDRLGQPEARDRVFADYPLLAERLGQYCLQQAEVFARFTGRLAADWERIVAAFGRSGSLPAKLSLDAGDVHNGGQSVIILTCEDGGKVVYKPRDIAVEVAFDQLQGHLNDALGEDMFRRVRGLPREGYGWVEHVAAAPCRSQAEVTRFYERIGGLLALLHLLGAFDLHQENLIADGAYPVVVDLETLFFSFKNDTFLGREDPFLKAAEYPAVKALLGSVMSTLMLPQHARNENVSAIAGGEAAPRVALRFDPERKRIAYQEDGTAEFLNRPVLDGALVAPEGHAGAIVTGFARLYGHVQENRDGYAAPEGPFGRVADNPTRVVMRDTQIYTDLLERSWHPALLGEGHGLVIHVLQLWRAAAGTPSTVPLLPEELAQLLAGDVPYFTQEPKGVEVRTGSGAAVPGYALDRSGFAAMQERLARMGPADLALQSWIIEGALDTGLREGKGRYPRSARRGLGPGEERAALDIVHRAVMETAQRGGGLLDWLTVTPTPEETLMLAPVDVTLYNGISGLTLYLAYAAEVTGTGRDAAEAALANLERQIADDWGGFAIPGAMSGLGGAAYCLLHLAALWDRPDLLDRAFELLSHDARIVAEDAGLFDLTVGAAGLVCVACAGAEASGEGRFRDLAETLGQRLIAMARQDERGRHWIAQEGERPLTGLSHGFSGVILALARLERIAPDPARLDIARAAMARENADFVAARRNWIDWRYANLERSAPEDPSNFQYFWCNGGAGIGLARLALQPFADDPQILSDVQAAALSTLEGGIGHNHSLCHGDMGNTDFLRQAAGALGDAELMDRAEEAYGRAVNTILEGHIYGGASRRAAPPDLMTGISGVGWGILRHMAPDRVPDVLSLAAPGARG